MPGMSIRMERERDIMSMFSDALDWVRGNTKDPPPVEEKKEKEPPRSITRDEAENLLVRCEGCGVPQVFINGGCRECGAPLPDPVVPEVIIEEKVVREYIPAPPRPSVYGMPYVAVSTGGLVEFGTCSTNGELYGDVTRRHT